MFGYGISQMFAIMAVSLLSGAGVNPGYILSMLINGLTIVAAVVVLLVLVVLQLLGIIPNPWPWMI